MAKENENDTLDFEDAKNLTVQEALRKHKEIEAGVTEEDGVLDRYIKQHKDQVAAEKFETQSSDFDAIDTSSLDSFIQKQKEELANQGLLSKDKMSDDTQEATATETASTNQAEELEEPAVTLPVETEKETQEEPPAPKEELAEDDLVPESDLEADKASSKKGKAVLVGGLVVLLAAIVGGGFALNSWGKQSTTTVSSKTSSSSSSSQKESSDYQTFDKLYKSFFLDKKQTQLKNSQFNQLSTLQSDLKKLEGTSYHKTAKAHYDSLNKQITAIKTVNNLFDKAIIVDGKLVDDAKAKQDANFDNLGDDTLKTGNATLDQLIADAIAKGKAQQAAAQSSASSSSAANAAAQAPSNAGASDSASGIPSGGNIRQSGITNYNPASLQRDRSRVPYNADAVKDVNNSAWIFGDGVLEKVVSTSQSRGYFSGNDYILEPVNIINGHGYYNMYKSDGTYLFSINAQTGYFVGNASGHSDGLDY